MKIDHYRFKTALIEALMNRGVFTKPVSSTQIVTRCPYCGDSVKRYDVGHFYIKINPLDKERIVYNCFKCPEGGILGKDQLLALGINDANLIENINYINRTSNKYVEKYDNSSYLEWQYPEINPMSPKVRYVVDRLKYEFNKDEYKEIKLVPYLKEFLELNKLVLNDVNPYYIDFLDRDYVGFVTSMGGHMALRDITGKGKIKWLKFPLVPENNKLKTFYAVTSEVDIFSKDDIHINLAEGVMDILSVAYNLGRKKENNLNIAVLGKSYVPMFKWLINKGFVGKNIYVNIFSDRDIKGNEKDIHIESYTRFFKDLKYLIGGITVYYNRMGKDFGVPINEIEVEKRVIR